MQCREGVARVIVTDGHSENMKTICPSEGGRHEHNYLETLVNLKSVSDHYTGTEQSYKYENQFIYWYAADFSVDKKLTPKI